MQQNPGRYSGYDILVVLVGANDLGCIDITQTVEDLYELLSILQEANPKAAVYGCEVCQIFNNHDYKFNQASFINLS